MIVVIHVADVVVVVDYDGQRHPSSVIVCSTKRIQNGKLIMTKLCWINDKGEKLTYVVCVCAYR